MPATSNARLFFDGIVKASDPVAAIRSLIDPTDPTYEDTWLECKGEDPTEKDPKRRERKARAYWSENLSGFANTSGGVLIWGLDSRQTEVNGRKLDIIHKEVPIDDPVRLASRLQEWQGQSTMPPISGVEVKPFRLPEDASKGFVVCFVPEGPFKPYQSNHTEDKQYYMRASGSTFVMDQSILRSLFWPQSNASFLIKAKLWWEYARDTNIQGVHNPIKVLVLIDIVNVGTATAKEPVVVIQSIVAAAISGFGLNTSDSRWVVRRENSTAEFSSIVPLHPGRTKPLAYAEWYVRPAPVLEYGGEGPGGPAPEFNIEIFCENHDRQHTAMVFDQQWFKKAEARSEASAFIATAHTSS